MTKLFNIPLISLNSLISLITLVGLSVSCGSEINSPYMEDDSSYIYSSYQLDSVNIIQIADCNYSETKIYAHYDIRSKTVKKVSYTDTKVLYNRHTGNYDEYLKEGMGDLIRYRKEDSALILYLNGIEVSSSPYENKEFILDYLSLLPRETWINRQAPSPWRHTIHSGCEYGNLDIFR